MCCEFMCAIATPCPKDSVSYTAPYPLSTSFPAVFSEPLGAGEVLPVLGNHSAAESHPRSLLSSILLSPALSATVDTAESHILMKAGRPGS